MGRLGGRGLVEFIDVFLKFATTWKVHLKDAVAFSKLFAHDVDFFLVRSFVFISGNLFPEDHHDEEMRPIDVKYVSPDQLSKQLLTLSLLPEYRWKHLAKQDLIRERNKPKEALKLPEKAPFFLPTVPGLEPKFDTSTAKGVATVDATSRKDKFGPRLIGGRSAVLAALETADGSSDSSLLRKPFDLLAEMSPSQIESELRLLSPDTGGSMAVFKTFLRCASSAIEDGKAQELLQSYLELFIRLHLSTLESEFIDEELVELLGALRENVAVATKRVENLLDQSLNVVQFLKHVAL